MLYNTHHGAAETGDHADDEAAERHQPIVVLEDAVPEAGAHVEVGGLDVVVVDEDAEWDGLGELEAQTVFACILADSNFNFKN